MSRKIGFAMPDPIKVDVKTARIQCSYCDKTYASHDKLDAHIAKEHADKLGEQ